MHDKSSSFPYSPMEELSKTRETYGKIASKYDKEHSDIDEIRRHADSFVSMIDGNVLDVGCGPGRDARYFEENGLFVTGIDITPEFIEIAKERSPNSEFISMDARYLSFPDNMFNGVWSCASLLHLPKADLPKAIGEAYRVLKDDGIFFVSLKGGYGEGYVGENGLERHFSFYSQNEVRRLLENEGFSIISMETEKKRDDWISVFAKKKRH